ncbi:MAG TPA: methyltransferase domain-containing protein [Burkholderiales bacterium]|jgi:predicted SAM-dependent methyltransferase
MKLHIGGTIVKDGWKILNIQAGPGVDYVGDISDLGQFAARSVDEIYASHVLEHVRAADVEKTLGGIFRVLKTGGRFLVSVPDMDVLSRVMLEASMPAELKRHFIGMIFGGQKDAYDYHYFGWNFQLMQYFFDEAGFMETRRVESLGLFDDTSEMLALGQPISLNAIAIK